MATGATSEPVVPAAPWSAPRPETRIRPVINRARIAEVALQMIAAEGVEAVSMRRIAAELGTGAASLYAYVSGKDEVLQLAYEAVVMQLSLDGLDQLSWQDAVRSWSRQMHAIYGRYQDIARLSFADVPSGPRALDLVETMLTALVHGGVPVQIASWLLDQLSLYVGADAFEGWLLQQRFTRPSGPDDERSPSERGHAWFQQLGDYLRTLPTDRYPTVTSAASALITGNGESRFAFGVELLIAGACALGGLPLDRPFDPQALISGAWFRE